jgi:hypothetical protein
MNLMSPSSGAESSARLNPLLAGRPQAHRTALAGNNDRSNTIRSLRYGRFIRWTVQSYASPGSNDAYHAPKSACHRTPRCRGNDEGFVSPPVLARRKGSTCNSADLRALVLVSCLSKPFSGRSATAPAPSASRTSTSSRSLPLQAELLRPVYFYLIWSICPVHAVPFRRHRPAEEERSLRVRPVNQPFCPDSPRSQLAGGFSALLRQGWEAVARQVIRPNALKCWRLHRIMAIVPGAPASVGPTWSGVTR